ncbi:hypothetical protein [Actinocrispum wychmicini]|uniref:Uncharacterized protein n=1 Tax=Actinocrispum wychmicini TaxID=1213861 RepID=A0A4R2KGH4_9PSEU|nr:hypothetical protein [Actinocrispum wychmicini]TCO65535.1 hypothetical protein EV192_1011327 [Actinocrispum wychmicini]
MNKRLLGVPVWVVFGLVVGALVGVAVYQKQPKVSSDVRAVVEGFRHGSVYVERGAPPVVNPDRVRQVIGDRPIVVAILADRPLPPGRPLVRSRQKFCGDVAVQVPTNEVIIFGTDEKDGYGSAFCTGKQFSNPDNPVKAGNFDFPLIAAAETAWKYRISATDLTPQVEEYVLAFDAQVSQDKVATAPRRGAVPDKLAAGDVVLSLGGIVAASVALFFLFSVVGWFFGRERRGNVRRLALDARLSKVGDYVLRADPQQDKQAEVSREYVLVLRALEDGEDVGSRVKKLERMIR